MGEGEESGAETKANHISSRQKANRGGTKGEVGEVESCKEEIGGLDWANGLTLAYRLKYIHTASANKTIVTIQRDEPLISVFLAIRHILSPTLCICGTRFRAGTQSLNSVQRASVLPNPSLEVFLLSPWQSVLFCGLKCDNSNSCGVMLR